LHLQSAQDAEAQQHIQVATTLAHQLSGQLGADFHGKTLGRGALTWSALFGGFRIFVLGTHSWTGCERVHLSPPERNSPKDWQGAPFLPLAEEIGPEELTTATVRLGLPPDERGWHGKGLREYRRAIRGLHWLRGKHRKLLG